MIKKSYAKINFAINILSKLNNGYHELDMIMSKVDLYDKLYFSLFDEDKIILTCTNDFIPTDERNLVYQVAHRIKEKYQIKTGIRINIVKSIPVQAGLGGGSSNAATTVETLNEMFDLNMSLEEKIDLVKDLGSDIPFFLHGSTCRVQGIGDIITNIENNLTDVYVVLVKPPHGISTKLVYQNIDLNAIEHPNIDGLVQALKNNNYNYVINNIKNSLQESSIQLRPVIKDLQDELLSLGVDVTLVCGSGSTIFALTKSEVIIKKIKKSHVNKRNFVYITKLL